MDIKIVGRSEGSFSSRNFYIYLPSIGIAKREIRLHPAQYDEPSQEDKGYKLLIGEGARHEANIISQLESSVSGFVFGSIGARDFEEVKQFVSKSSEKTSVRRGKIWEILQKAQDGLEK